jgi:hypothetical protein
MSKFKLSQYDTELKKLYDKLSEEEFQRLQKNVVKYVNGMTPKEIKRGLVIYLMDVKILNDFFEERP